jgi:hypothetical protein
MGFQTICKRKSRLRIKGHFYNAIIINVYAPTETADQEEIEQFCASLPNVYDTYENMMV